MWTKLKAFIRAKNRNRGECEREELLEAKRELKRVKEAVRKAEWENKLSKVENCKKIADIWDAIKPSKLRRAVMGKQISKREWVEYFQKLLGGKTQIGGKMIGNLHTVQRDTETVEEGSLNREIEWVLKALREMKSEKGAGEDGIAVEFLKGMPESGLREVTEILSNLCINGEIARGWETGRIYPIHKGGDARVVSN